MAEKQQITQTGYNELQVELRTLIEVTQEEVKQQLAEARAQGDLKENADYDAARARQAEVEGRIKEIEYILANCEIIVEDKNAKKVALGSIVTVLYENNGKQYTYQIVGTVESNPFEGRISNASPLGEALIGKKVNDIVEVKGGKNGAYSVKVLKIEVK